MDIGRLRKNNVLLTKINGNNFSKHEAIPMQRGINFIKMCEIITLQLFHM